MITTLLAILLLPLAEILRMWYAVPLVVSISLVYAASRHEEPGPILHHAAKNAGGIVMFVIGVTAVLEWLSRGL